MKTLMAFLLFLTSFPPGLFAQQEGDLLQKVSAAISAGHAEQAVVLFRRAIRENADKAEMFYWTNVDKNSDISVEMAADLASYYKKVGSYDKSHIFYKELLQRKQNDVSTLSSYAEVEMARGKEKEALHTYEQILRLDADNLAANIFMGNYYYLMAEQEKHRLETDYKKIIAPTRMQYAGYRNELNRVLAPAYAKAKECLEKVVRQFPSAEANKTLDKICMLEKELAK